MTTTDSPADRPTLRIRRAVAADAKALSTFASAVFSATFAADNDPHDMQLYLAATFSEALQLAEICDSARVCLLVESEGQLAAYAMLRIGATAPQISGERPMEIQRFYVDQAWHGQGIAGQLMDACFSVAREHDADTVWLGVWERNPRAIRFYEKRGFADVGSYEFLLGHDRQTDRLMARPVNDEAAS